MSNGPRVRVYFVVIATNHGFIAEEVNRVILDTIWKVDVVFDVIEAVCFIPAGREDIKRDLATNGISIRSNRSGQCLGYAEVCQNLRQSQIRKLFPQCLYKSHTNTLLVIKCREGQSLSLTSVPPHRTNIDHAIPELNKSAPHDW
jgi:hypothetical protein